MKQGVKSNIKNNQNVLQALNVIADYLTSNSAGVAYQTQLLKRAKEPNSRFWILNSMLKFPITFFQKQV